MVPVGTGPTAAADWTNTRKARRYGFACTACKTRKVKCSGEQPTCAGCRRSGDDCVWPSNPKSNDPRLLRNANERIRHLEASLDRQASPSSPAASRWPRAANANANETYPVDEPGGNGRDPAGGQHPSTHSNRPATAYTSTTPASTTRTNRASRRASSTASRRRPGSRPGTGLSPNATHRVEDASPSSNAADASNPGLASSLWFQVGIGEDGTVIYNGPTSRFHAGSLLEGDKDEGGDGDDDDDEPNGAGDEEEDAFSDEFADAPATRGRTLDPTAGHLATLRSQYDLMDSVWMPLIAAKPTMNATGVDTETGLALLEIYWAWLHPLHHLVYRPAFLMDLALGGPHCSDFLLLCIFGLAAKHLPSEGDDQTTDSDLSRGEHYVGQAKALLLDEMAASSPSIPTIQGLLILGGRQCAIGRSSEGWLYTGMAIRMMQDIGLHLDTTRLVGLMERWTPAETETRKRLYNSAYVWDKTLSLALGRPPSLVRRPYPPNEILDKFDDQRLWHPVHAKEVAQSFAPCPSWVTSTMCVFSRLHEVTTDMMLLFSRSSGAGKFTEQVQDLDARFCRWYEETPDGLKIDEPALLKHSPPPHIVSLNLLYHTLHILLRRPFLSAASQSSRNEHLSHCITHSKKIHAIHTLYTQTFPHRLMTYQVSYCIYTAATVEALELKSALLSPSEREQAAARLTAAVRILQNEASHTPGSGKSLDTIRRLLSEGPRPRTRSQGHNPRRRKIMRFRRQQRSETGGQETDGVGGSDGRGDVVMEDDEEDDRPMPLVSSEQAAHNNMVVSGYAASRGEQTMGSGRPMPGLAPGAGSHGNMEAVSGGQQQPGFALPGVPDAGGGVGGYEAAWDAELGFYGNTDTGAGFHPGAFSWGISDDFPRIPPPLPQSSSTSGSTLHPHPGLSAQGWFMSRS